MRSWRESTRTAQWWHFATFAIAAVSLIIQLILVLGGTNVLVPEGEATTSTWVRTANYFSYFTVQSNILVAVSAATLMINPRYDGTQWRIMRIAGLIGIAVTGVVYVTLLRPIVDLDGIPALTNIGFHYLTPLLAVIGWALFGPWPRVDRRSILWSLVWPVAYLIYTLIRGEIRNWYPYPFIDVSDLGYGRTLLNSLGITVVLLGVGWLFMSLDRRRGGERAAVRG